MFPYRQKDLIGKLQEALPNGPAPNAYDLQAINRVHNVANDDRLSWKPQFSARQYSDALVEWIVERVNGDATFLRETRDRYRQINAALQRSPEEVAHQVR